MLKLVNFIRYINNNFTPKQKILLGITIATSLLASIVAAISPVILAMVIDQLLETIHSKDWSILIILTLGYLIVLSLGRLLPVLSNTIKMILQIDTRLIVSHSFFKYIYQQKPTYFEKNNSGAVAQRSVQLINELYSLLTIITDGFLGPIFKIILTMSIIFVTGDLAIFLLFGFYILSFVTSTQFFTKKLVPIKNELMNAGKNAYKIQTDSFENITTARNNNAFSFLFNRYKSILNIEKNKAISYAKWTNYMILCNSVLSIILFGGCFIYSLYCVIEKGYTIGYFVMITSYIVMLSLPIEWMGQYYSKLKQSISFLNSFIQDCNKIANEQSALALDNCDQIEVVINDLSFKYTNVDHSTLTDIDVIIPTGQFVTFTGPSGSGKTTLAKLIASNYSEYQGSIKINQNEINSYSIQSIKDKIYFVTQDEFIFMDTLRFNLLVAKPNATDNELLTALSLANFNYQDIGLLNSHELLEMKLGNRGTTISGGQRQRISLARLFLRNPALIIIDEGTSSLDLVNEKIIIDNINQVFPRATKISISHRPTTFSYSDLIYVFDDGKIADHGSLDNLLLRNNYIQKITHHRHK